ncbi:MAG: DUF349 domain-containing protein [bacterium]
MENRTNTDQNPEQENISTQEENSLPVPVTEEPKESTPSAEETPIENPPTLEETGSPPEPEEFPSNLEDISEPVPAEEPAGPVLEELHEQEEEEKEHESDEDFGHHSREHLLELLEKAVVDPDINSVKIRIALIKVAYLKKKEELLHQYAQAADGETLPASPEEADELDKRFDTLFSVYKANKGRYLEEQEKLKKENLKKKLQILEDLRQLINSEETLKKTYDEFKVLQDQWKEIGMVPRSEINNLWQNYHFLVEKFFEKVKLNKELKDLDLKKNLEAKIELCEKTEELLLETSLLKSFKQLQKYHDEWKEIGPVPSDKKDEIWERFKNTTDKINERRREHYNRIEEEQTRNLETKTALCKQAEEVLTLRNESLKEWQDHTHKVNEFLKIWKSVGPVPQKHNTEIWSRFKTCLDIFFANKKEFFDKLKDQQMHNYNLKLELCVQAEAAKTSTDWKKTTNDLIRLQEEWKKIGPVPRKHADKIWKRFRTACDEFFNTKSSYFSNIHTHEEENLKKKNELLQQLKEYPFGENKNENLKALKEFQRHWTEVGYVPIKEKEHLQNEFRTLVNQHLDKLKISEVEMTAVSYQSRMEAMKNDPQARKLMGRERDNLMAKISKLRDDINLWENNIGFLAKSKNAIILKVEFEKKIDKAKSELKVMEAKLKILRQQ